MDLMDHNGLSLYHKRVSRRIKNQFTCLGENTQKYITFTVLIGKEVTRVDKNGEEISYIYLTKLNISIWTVFLNIKTLNMIS